MLHLKSIAVREWPAHKSEQFPFTLPLIRSLRELEFASPVTFFVGENGSGKSTVLETIACAINSITIGSESVKTDKTLAAVRQLAFYFRLSWSKRTSRGFFLRAEDFFGYAKQLNRTRAELEADLRAVDQDFAGQSEFAQDLARMPHQRELSEIQRRYGEGLDHRSHGESFLALFQTRFVPGGLYLLDEPEAPLSPLRQLAFLAALKQMVEQDAQFIIATHSPLLLAFPGATILGFDSGEIRLTNYNDLEHVSLTKAFLNNPDAYLRQL